MSSYGPLENVKPMGAGPWFGTCPSCGLRARMDDDQLRGRVSVDCPECDYHETHDQRPARADRQQEGDG